MARTVRQQTNLVRRSGVYVFRVAIPADLRGHFNGTQEVRKSLRTRDKAEAIKLAAAERVHVLAEFERIRATLNPEHRESLTDQEVARLVASWSAAVLADDERRRALGVIDLDDAHERLSEGDDALREALPTGSVAASGLAPEVGRLLREHGLYVPPGSPAWRMLAWEMLKGAAKINSAVRARSTGTWIDTPPAPPPLSRGPSLSSLLDYWKSLLPRRPRTLAAFKDAVERFSALHPTLTDARQITKAHVIAYRDALLGQGLSPRTVGKLLTMVSAVLQCAADGEKVEHNVAARIKVPMARSAARPRVAFNAEDVQKISAALSTLEKSDPLRWIIVLAFATGGRLAELCALRVQDVQHDAGVPFIVIAPEAGPLKSASAARRVPLHPGIVQTFMVYVAGCSGERLFPGVTAPALGKRAGRLLRRAGIEDPRKVLHSARHWFRDQLRAAGIGEEVSDNLMGHSRGSTGRAYGGDVFPIGPLAAAVASIKLPFPD